MADRIIFSFKLFHVIDDEFDFILDKYMSSLENLSLSISHNI